ncbi:MAG: PLDc N-terminal domain-containing protein [Dehalococcoidia bacterium]
MEWWEFFLVMIVVMPIVVMWVACLIDIIGRPDISGWAKAGWMLGVLFFPLVGSIIYVIMRPALVRGTRAYDDIWGTDPNSLPNPR